MTETGLKATRGLWLGRQLMSTAASRRDLKAMRKACRVDLGVDPDHAELSTLAVQGSVHELRTAPAEAVERLSAARELTPVHPTLIETLAEAHEAAGNLAEAADLFEESARQSQTRERNARLHYRAGVLLQERIQAPDRAREAYQRAAEADIGFKDVQARLEQLLSGRNDLGGLVALAEASLNAAQAPQLRLELARKLAQLYVKQDEHEKAVTVLRAALELTPEDLPACRSSKACSITSRISVNAPRFWCAWPVCRAIPMSCATCSSSSATSTTSTCPIRAEPRRPTGE